MKLLAINLLFILLSLSCDNEKSGVLVSQARSQTPYYPSVQFYILEAPQVGAMTSLDDEFWKSDQKGVGFSTEDLDEITNQTINRCGMKTEYAGSSNSGSVDYHLITISTPYSEPVTTEVAYDGSEQVLLKDDRYKVGIRPVEQ
jgi:hypothetical protein